MLYELRNHCQRFEALSPIQSALSAIRLFDAAISGVHFPNRGGKYLQTLAAPHTSPIQGRALPEWEVRIYARGEVSIGRLRPNFDPPSQGRLLGRLSLPQPL